MTNLGRGGLFVGGLVMLVMGLAFFTGYLPNATYSYWLAEAIANGTFFMVLGVVFMAASVLG